MPLSVTSPPTRSRFVWFNGGITDQPQIDVRTNRAFRYGDGLIETICMQRGELLFFHDHMDRLFAGMQALMLPLDVRWNARYFYDCITRILLANEFDTAARIRIQIWRTGEGFYKPLHQGVDVLIETTETKDEYMFNDVGLSADVSTSVRKVYDRLANVKTMSALTYVIAALESQSKNVDLMFVLNERNAIADVPGRNVFILEKGKVITPPLTDAPVAGVFRHQLLQLLRSHQIITLEESISVERLGAADEIFVTNVTEGIQPITTFQNKTYPTVQSKELYRLFRNHLLHTHEH